MTEIDSINSILQSIRSICNLQPMVDSHEDEITLELARQAQKDLAARTKVHDKEVYKVEAEFDVFQEKGGSSQRASGWVIPASEMGHPSKWE